MNQRSWLKALSGLFINLSAAWYTLAFITPNFIKLDSEGLNALIFDVFFGTILLVFTVRVERRLNA